MLSRTRRRVLTTVLVLLALPSRAEDEPRKIGLKAGVEAVAAEIEVLVTDAKGHPVLDLSKEDFRLLVDGQPMPVDWVEAPPAEYQGSRAVAAVPARDADAERTAAATPPAPRASHSTVLFIDDLHLDFGPRKSGLDGLRKLVRSLPPEEEVSVYAFRAGLRRVLGFTRDRDAVLGALDRAGRTIPESWNADEGGAEWMGRTRQLLQATALLFRSLAGRPESKTVVMLAGALASDKPNPKNGSGSGADLSARSRPAAASFVVPETPPSVIGEETSVAPLAEGDSFLAPQRRRTADEALLARATLVAIDPSGLHVELGMDDDRQTQSQGAAPPRREPVGFSWRYASDALAAIARETGGSRLGFTNDPGGALVKETALLARRYRIGFTPAGKGSARRDVRVEVRRPGVQVRAASGQRTSTAQMSGRARFESLLLSNEKPIADFSFRVLPRETGRMKRKALKYELYLPLAELLFEQSGDRLAAEVEILFAAVDGEGRSGGTEFRPTIVRLREEDVAARAGYLRYPATLDVSIRGRVRLVFGVRDVSTGRLGVASVDVKL